MCKHAISDVAAKEIGLLVIGLLVIGLVASIACSASWADQDTNGHAPRRILPNDCWEIHSLGTLGGPFSSARDLNNSGQVTGNAATEPRILDPADPPYTFSRPYISAPNGGKITEILTGGTLYGYATAINNAGQVVGDTTIGRSFPVSFITDPGGGNVRNTLAWTYVRDINNVGQTLWDIWYPNFRSVIGANDQPDMQGTNLIEVTPPVTDPWTAFVTAVALNDAGQVAVNVSDAGNPSGLLTAYRWSSYEGAINLAPDAIASRATAMNDAGQVVGIIRLNNPGQAAIEQAFVTRRYNTTRIMLGAAGDGNTPEDINNLSQIVGTKTVAGQTHGYVTAPFNVNGSIDLETLQEITRDGWSNIRPTAINDRGQIAGTGRLSGNDRAFLLSPQSLQAYVPDHHGKHATCYRFASGD